MRQTFMYLPIVALIPRTVLPNSRPLEIEPPYLYFSYSFLMYFGASSLPIKLPLMSHLSVLVLAVPPVAGTEGNFLNPRRFFIACCRSMFCVPDKVLVCVGISSVWSSTCDVTAPFCFSCEEELSFLTTSGEESTT